MSGRHTLGGVCGVFHFHRGFTLIELLVVVAIIALLVSILLPTLTKAKEQARQSYCMNNQRNIASSLAVYNTDWGTVPYNYADYGTYRNDPDGDGRDDVRWALGCLNGYVGGSKGVTDLRGLDEGEFPDVYICPSADRGAVFSSSGNVDNKYHACYWTNVAVRLNRGFIGSGGALFGTWTHTDKPAGWDGDSSGEARYTGRKCCPKCQGWRSVYHPRLDTIKNPSGCAFTGDTNNAAATIATNGTIQYTTEPGEWRLRPGWGHVGGHLGWDRHQGVIIMGHVDAHASRLSWEEVLASYVLFGGSSEDMTTAMPTGDFMMLYLGDDVCDWPGGDFDDRIHHLPAPVAE